MSANTDTDERSITELRRMDKATAERQLSKLEYDRWESVNQHLDEAEEVRQEWADNDAEATDILTNDMTAVASEVDLFGDSAKVYYDPEDSRIRDVAKRLGDVVDVDIENVTDLEADAADIDDAQIEPAKELLAEFVGLTIVEWNGTAWGDIPAKDREALRVAMSRPRPDGWGLAGLMDAMSEIMTAVESERDERLERVQKFRNPERRGDR